VWCASVIDVMMCHLNCCDYVPASCCDDVLSALCCVSILCALILLLLMLYQPCDVIDDEDVLVLY
jgi:hypothetical protein